MSIPKGFSEITDLTTAKGLHQGSLGAIPGGTTYALVQCETTDIRWRDDGTNPTATVGFLLKAGDAMVYDANLAAVRFIQTAANAQLNITFYSDSPVSAPAPEDEEPAAAPRPPRQVRRRRS